MSNVLLHVGGYLLFALLLSVLVPVALGAASAGVHRRVTGAPPKPSESVWGRAVLEFGGWFAGSLLFLAFMLSPNAKGLQLFGVALSVGGAVVFGFFWKPLLRDGFDRLDRQAVGEPGQPSA